MARLHSCPVCRARIPFWLLACRECFKTAPAYLRHALHKEFCYCRKNSIAHTPRLNELKGLILQALKKGTE